MQLVEVHVLDPNGNSMLNNNGTGAAVVNSNGEITQINCGPFLPNKLPVVNKKHIISGRMVRNDTKIDFKVTLTCTTAGAPDSVFS